jgi:phosphomannomutase / phosphoglucomutase
MSVREAGPSVVVESPVSETRMRGMFKAVDAVLHTHKEVGEYNQTIECAAR